MTTLDSFEKHCSDAECPSTSKCVTYTKPANWLNTLLCNFKYLRNGRKTCSEFVKQ